MFQRPGAGESELLHWAGVMAATLIHRGPDDAGCWAKPEAGVSFGFRRLAIIDLSPNGHQPMSSASGRYTMVFNGEVFNHRELRRELVGMGATFRGHGDSEVILAAFERWGIEPAVTRFVGMFAIAAVLTPPDIVSQTCLAVPLIILYEVSIISCRMVEKARAKREAEEEAELAGGGNPAAPGE